MEPKLTKDEKKAIRQEEVREKESRERKNHFWKMVAIWSIAGLLLVLALWALVIFSSGTSQQTTTNIAVPKITAKDYQSYPDAKTTLIEYADFQCPACEAYYPLIKQLQVDFGSKLNIVYRFFPLKTIHQNALNAAKAAYAAGLQNTFWPMHDKLFDTQNNWATLPDPESTFLGYAKDLGLDTNKFKKDYEASATDTVVNNAYNNDISLGLDSTPTFFVNGKMIVNPQSYADFKTLIQNAMK